MKLTRHAIRTQIQICHWFDRTFLSPEYRHDGNRAFLDALLPNVLREHPAVSLIDVGSGKRPAVSPELKRALALKVTGLDISAEELRNAPIGSYDHIIVADAEGYREDMQADIAICCALLEHVRDTSAVIGTLAYLLRADGLALLFVPCGHSLFARLNRILPESFKRRALFSLFPQTRIGQGFPAFYNCCTPREIGGVAQSSGFDVEQLDTYFYSGYLEFFAPFFILWRLFQLACRAIARDEACESFSVVLRKRSAVY